MKYLEIVHKERNHRRKEGTPGAALQCLPLALGKQLWAVSLTRAAAVLVPWVVVEVVGRETDVLGHLGQGTDKVAEHLGRLQDKNLRDTGMSEHTWRKP